MAFEQAFNQLLVHGGHLFVVLAVLSSVCAQDALNMAQSEDANRWLWV